MNILSRTLAGGVMIVVGLILVIVAFFNWVSLIYGLPILILGLFIFFNRKEDKVERIKDSQSSAEDVEREQIKLKGRKK